MDINSPINNEKQQALSKKLDLIRPKLNPVEDKFFIDVGQNRVQFQYWQQLSKKRMDGMFDGKLSII